MSAETKRRNLYGRRQGHKLHPRQARLVENLLPQLRVTPEAVARGDVPSRDFAQSVLEIGFGGGEHLAAQAQNHPDTGFIGCEPFVNGVAKLLLEIERRNLKNVKIYDHDARDLMDILPAASFDQIYLLYPDPWPKLRHHKRRFVSPENLAHLHRLLKPEGRLMIASDIADYILWTLHHMRAFGGFRWTGTQASDWQEPPQGWPSTRYEAKALKAGRVPTYLHFQRRADIQPNHL